MSITVRFAFVIVMLLGIIIGCSATDVEGPSSLIPTSTLVAPSPQTSPTIEATSSVVPEPNPISTPTPTQGPTLTLTPTGAPTATPATPPTLPQHPTPIDTPTVEPTPTPPLEPTATAMRTPKPTEAANPTWTPQSMPETWRGLIVAPENRCSPYSAEGYSYSQSVEGLIVESMGGLVYGPYTGTHFESTLQTDIEHIVARSEAHDSGLCAADAETRKRFAADLLNLTLASPGVNRHQKSAKDAAEWLPDLNQCWFADRVVQVRQRYKLTIDESESSALEMVLSGCSSLEMVVISGPPENTPTPTPTPVADALAMYDDNGNGRITCAEARNHGIAPVHEGHPAYSYMNDADNDGVVCE